MKQKIDESAIARLGDAIVDQELPIKIVWEFSFVDRAIEWGQCILEVLAETEAEARELVEKEYDHRTCDWRVGRSPFPVIIPNDFLLPNIVSTVSYYE